MSKYHKFQVINGAKIMLRRVRQNRTTRKFQPLANIRVSLILQNNILIIKYCIIKLLKTFAYHNPDLFYKPPSQPKIYLTVRHQLLLS